MKASDLRIGNYVLHSGVMKQVYRISNKGVDFYLGETKKGIYTQSFKYEALEPIPLTEEWLLRFGLFKSNNGWFRKTETPSHNKEIVTLSINVDTFSTAIFGDEALEPSYIKECQFVHQLQNLYYTLTGEELTLKQ